MITLNTPLIDAALIQLRSNPQLTCRLQSLIPDFAKSKEVFRSDVMVYNAAYKDAKQNFSWALRLVLDPICQRFWNVYRDEPGFQLRGADIRSYIHLNHCAGMFKRLRKFTHIPEVLEYLAIMAEGRLLNDAVQAMKPHIKPRPRTPTPTAC